MGKIAHFLPVFARFVETAQKFNSTFVKIYRLQYWDTSAKIRAQRSTKQQAERSTKMKKDVYEIVTERFLEKLEQGIIPWRRPWKMVGGAFPAYPLGSKKPYGFINQMLLDFEQGEFATFETIKRNGGKVKKGEKSKLIVGWIHTTEKIKDENGEAVVDDEGNEQYKDRFALRYYQVFNVYTQVEGLKDDIDIEDETSALIESDFVPGDAYQMANDIIVNYTDREQITFNNGDISNSAYYLPSADSITVPNMSQFEDVNEYYSTVFHEVVHSTGHQSRLDRGLEKKAAHGSNEYSREELVAEIGSAALMNICGIESEDTFKNSAAYIQSWSKALKDSPKMIVYASAQAQKAVEYIIEK